MCMCNTCARSTGRSSRIDYRIIGGGASIIINNQFNLSYTAHIRSRSTPTRRSTCTHITYRIVAQKKMMFLATCVGTSSSSLVCII